MRDGICRTGLTGHLTPRGTLSRRSMPRAGVPGCRIYTAEVSLSSGSQAVCASRFNVYHIKSQPIVTCTEWPLILFLLLLRFLVSSAGCPFPAPVAPITDKYFTAKLIPLLTQIVFLLDVPDTLCPQRSPSLLPGYSGASPY